MWRTIGVALALTACSKAEPRAKSAPRVDAAARAKPPDAAPALPAHHDAPDLATAVSALVTDDVRVVGFGEIHERSDHDTGGAHSALSRFSDQVLPVIAARASDLVLETWIPDKTCGGQAEQATAAVEHATARPASTKSEIATLVDRARAAGIQPHAMHLGCDDWKKVAPPNQDIDYEAMLGIITRELGGIATQAAAARAQAPRHLIVVYGGALHNDLYPDAGVEDWSYAKKVDDATGGHYLEIDLYVPEYVALDGMSQRAAWFPLLQTAGPDHVVVIERGARSYIVILPTSR
jgi:hypothetical protein